MAQARLAQTCPATQGAPALGALDSSFAHKGMASWFWGPCPGSHTVLGDEAFGGWSQSPWDRLVFLHGLRSA